MSNNSSSIKIEFDDDILLDIFKFYISEPLTKRKINKMFIIFPKEKVLLFFSKLKDFSVILYNSNEELLKGQAYEINDTSTQKLIKDKKIGIICFSNDSVVTNYYKTYIKGNISTLKVNNETRETSLKKFVEKKDIILIDGTRIIMNACLLVSELLFKLRIPWILYQGVVSEKGRVGPLFFGKDTGCFSCFEKRIKSVDTFFSEKKNYYDWINDNVSKKGIYPDYIENFLLSVLMAETVKFLLNNPLLETYGNLVSFDINDYSKTISRLHKVPFCNICSENNTIRLAPWLE
ncbi:bacteriocin biosynthesis cyclodehydratase domain protein [Ichthyobacterium seriolicida]|uniref:Bacteriocin biosynthesis cyclodehydratase domain protein n=1 Tax=Ichthyobacterium seriolicida TaxID=242600 RepID=A0A1J1DXA3_9FLAO|nr:bacteriocin biosynthesis cyclodehydratase domain protein [Ichthyobacterium seriolicida]